MFSGIDDLAGAPNRKARGGAKKGGGRANNRRLNSETDIAAMGDNSDISSEEFENADDFDDQI